MMLPKYATLLLQILHRGPDRPDRATLAALEPADWDALIQEAIRVRLAFPLRDYLKANPCLGARVPAAALQLLDDTLRQTLNSNFCRQGQLQDLLSACAAAGIPLMLMKGLWLVEICQSWCLHKSLRQGRRRDRRSRRGHAAPSGGGRCAGHAGAR
ncbi:MAG: nucleotidyltransferase family protein, partial [Chromatiaceae bacterium]